MTLTNDLGQFSQSPSSHAESATTLTSEIGIQKKQRPTLQELLESPHEGKAPRKTAQTQLPTPPAAWTRLPTSPPAQQTHADPVDHKRKREDKGKKVLETGRTQSSQEVDFQRGSKHPRGMQTRSAHEADKRGEHHVAAPAWAPPLKLDGSPLTSDASI